MNRTSDWWLGVLFTAFIAFLGYGAALIPGVNFLGPMACAIFIAILFRQIFDYPEKWRRGIEFSTKTLLRLAIVLYGLRLSMDTVFEDGLSLLVFGVLSIVLSIVLMIFLGKWWKADPSISLLTGVGIGVCGAAAIAAIAPIVKAKDEDTALSVAIIALIGTVFAVIYTIIQPIMPLTDSQYSVWTGLSLHELANVVLAGAAAGDEALALALLAKLGRVLLLIPLSFIFILWMKNKHSSNADSNISFPWFLLGFIGMSLIGSYVIDEVIFVPAAVLDSITAFSSFILTMAMVGLGLNISLADLRKRAWKPFLLAIAVSIFLSIIMFGAVKLMNI
ncbi:YeiH family protein [Jeotgalibacillus soli]|uniref:Uncharacterized protein n=1 Tax=Jeotgalibacillus soli TaxID=889306 RepID=A0A0C2W096_9BACL|nr:putative sulfate exporter family transporter [Jeotgalibacillus soli]KIL49608.1 hypothetical protein KP78_10760 [Jeotgalibacillus soli]